MRRARATLALNGDSVRSRLSLDTVLDNGRALQWLDSVSPGTAKKTLAAEDSIALRRGAALATIGDFERADCFIEPVELSCPENLQLQYRIALLYLNAGALTQASRAGRRLSWRIPADHRDSIPLSVYALMYPTCYGEFIRSEARCRHLDPCLVYAVIRQESVFDRNAVSPVGAMGLMQIMPSTGAAIARELGERYCVDTLRDPVANIRYGTHYLRRLLDQFNGNEVLALASYNGGTPNAKEWFSRNREKDFDLFVEDIDFSETRNYVKKVLANYWFYQKLFGIGAFGPLR